MKLSSLMKKKKKKFVSCNLHKCVLDLIPVPFNSQAILLKNTVFFMCTLCITETDIMHNNSLCKAITIIKGFKVQW
jgi:hypothetical protein